jgi:acetyltransferase-like isoleucine patch superfamily enzyme
VRHWDRLINLLLRAPTSVASRLRIFHMRALGADIGSRCRLGAVHWQQNPWDVRLAEGVTLDRGVVLLSLGERAEQPRIIIGRNSYINRYTMIDASQQVTIGSDVMIGPHCYITDHDHGTQPGMIIREQGLIEAAVRIDDNVWLGAHVTVLKGVRIGSGAVIGAGSVVTKSVPAGARMVGVPARRIGLSANGPRDK